MRARRILSLTLLLATFTAPAFLRSQTPAAPPTESPVPSAAAAPATTLPSDGNERARPAWYQNCRDRVAAVKGKPVDILFVGDSITESWTATAWGGVNRGAAVWDRTYAPRHALNFGVGADRTQDVLHRLDTMDVQTLTPRVTVLLIGTNNNHNTAPEIAAGVHAVLDKLRTMYPATKIILVSILPNARATQLMADANALLKTYADDSTVFYLDLAAAMSPTGDNFLGLGPDKLHPDESGYQLWATTMEPLLTRLLQQPAPAPRP